MINQKFWERAQPPMSQQAFQSILMAIKVRELLDYKITTHETPSPAAHQRLIVLIKRRVPEQENCCQ